MLVSPFGRQICRKYGSNFGDTSICTHELLSSTRHNWHTDTDLAYVILARTKVDIYKFPLLFFFLRYSNSLLHLHLGDTVQPVTMQHAYRQTTHNDIVDLFIISLFFSYISLHSLVLQFICQGFRRR